MFKVPFADILVLLTDEWTSGGKCITPLVGLRCKKKDTLLVCYDAGGIKKKKQKESSYI